MIIYWEFNKLYYVLVEKKTWIRNPYCNAARWKTRNTKAVFRIIYWESFFAGNKFAVEIKEMAFDKLENWCSSGENDEIESFATTGYNKKNRNEYKSKYEDYT